jgi:hypothetical protein
MCRIVTKVSYSNPFLIIMTIVMSHTTREQAQQEREEVELNLCMQ